MDTNIYGDFQISISVPFRAKIKLYTFFIINSIYYLSLRFLRKDVNFSLQVAKNLLTR